MDIRIDTKKISSVLEKNAREYAVELGLEEVGHVLEAGDGIARVDGLPGVMAEEMLVFPGDVYGMAMNLERDDVGVIILGDYTHIEQGDVVKRTCNVLRVPVGEALLGRVVTPLGRPLDGLGPINCNEFRNVETDAPGIVDREPVNIPLQTGLKSIDSMTAIGRGQRELIVGDRQTGKTSLALDAILNQKDDDVYCIYTAIGQKMSTVAQAVEVLKKHDRLRQTIVVVATAGDPSPLRYIAPFSGCAMAEFFMEAGKDALIVYDDLTKHAEAYREISLLLRRPPGREAFPGDIFYLHSRLLERASKLSSDKGGGSMTALPIVETRQGDYSAYIPTNLISITDGQIYLESDLFHQGFRPAINVGLSVSRVGGKAQLAAMKKVASTLRMDMAQYREVASFAQLTSDVDAATVAQLHRGERLAEVLKQNLHEPMSIERQIMILWAAIRGHLDDIPLCDISRFQKEWMDFVESAHVDMCKRLREEDGISENLESLMELALEQHKNLFVVTEKPGDMSIDRVIPKPSHKEHRVSKAVLDKSQYDS